MKYRVDMVRTERGVTIRGLARKAQVSKSHIQRIEANEVNPSFEVMCRIAKALKCEISELVCLH